jgi:hypothetical protein
MGGLFDEPQSWVHAAKVSAGRHAIHQNPLKKAHMLYLTCTSTLLSPGRHIRRAALCGPCQSWREQDKKGSRRYTRHLTTGTYLSELPHFNIAWTQRHDLDEKLPFRHPHRKGHSRVISCVVVTDPDQGTMPQSL